MSGTIAFVTTSKGRLHHLKQTLPLMVAQSPDELFVTDYGCPDGTGDWVETHYPSAKVVRVSDDPGFSLARARNLGAGQAQSEWLVIIDGDIKVRGGWRDWMQGNLRPGHFYRAAPAAGKRDPDSYGTCICRRSDFEMIGGYDEAFRNWGGEDDDMYERLARAGVVAQDYPAEFVDGIRHGDEERAGLSAVWDQDRQRIVNRSYRRAKAELTELRAGTGPLPLEERRQLFETTLASVAKWFNEGAVRPLKINYTVRRSKLLWLPPPYRMIAELVFSISIGVPMKQS